MVVAEEHGNDLCRLYISCGIYSYNKRNTRNRALKKTIHFALTQNAVLIYCVDMKKKKNIWNARSRRIHLKIVRLKDRVYYANISFKIQNNYMSVYNYQFVDVFWYSHDLPAHISLI